MKYFNVRQKQTNDINITSSDTGLTSLRGREDKTKDHQIIIDEIH